MPKRIWLRWKPLWGLKCENPNHLYTPSQHCLTSLSQLSLPLRSVLSVPHGRGMMFHSRWLLVSIVCQFVFTPNPVSGRRTSPSFQIRIVVWISNFVIVICSINSLTSVLPTGMSTVFPYVVKSFVLWLQSCISDWLRRHHVRVTVLCLCPWKCLLKIVGEQFSFLYFFIFSLPWDVSIPCNAK